jgi:aryl-alcohol dehydrogenase-like predicted oxidoreductase
MRAEHHLRQRGIVGDRRRRRLGRKSNRHSAGSASSYQCQWLDQTGTPVEDSWTTMAALVDEGKVRAIGVSSFVVSLLARCEAIRHVDSLQPHFSLINRRAAYRELPWCASHDTCVIGYSPMQSEPADGELHRGSRIVAGRLAAPRPRVPGTEPAPQSAAPRCAGANRETARHVARGSRHSARRFATWPLTSVGEMS